MIVVIVIYFISLTKSPKIRSSYFDFSGYLWLIFVLFGKSLFGWSGVTGLFSILHSGFWKRYLLNGSTLRFSLDRNNGKFLILYWKIDCYRNKVAVFSIRILFWHWCLIFFIFYWCGIFENVCFLKMLIF